MCRARVQVLWSGATGAPTRALLARRGPRRRARRRVRAGAAVMLAGRRLLVTGVLDRHSIAFAIAARAQELGAEVVLTGFGRTRRMTERAPAQLPAAAEVLELDVNSDAGPRARSRGARAALGRRSTASLHAVAYAPAGRARRRLPGHPLAERGDGLPDKRVLAEGARRGAAPAARARAGRRGRRGARLRRRRGVARLRLDGRGEGGARGGCALPRARPRPRGVRVNLVSAGPIHTLAAGGIPGFEQLAELWSKTAPLRWDPEDASAGRRRRLLPAVAARARDHRRDPPRRRRLPRDGLPAHRRFRAVGAPPRGGRQRSAAGLRRAEGAGRPRARCPAYGRCERG